MSNKNLFKSLWLLMLFLVVGTVSAQVTTQEEFVTECANAASGDVITLGSGEFNLNAIKVTGGKSLTFVGNGKENTTLKYGSAYKQGYSDGGGVACYSFDGSGFITIKNAKLEDYFPNEGNDYDHGFVRAGGMLFEDCEIASSAGCWGNNTVTGTGVTFKNCLFTAVSTSMYSVVTYQANSYVFEGCTFAGNAKGVVKLYRTQDKSTNYNFVIKDCKFEKGSNTGKTPIYFYNDESNGGVYNIFIEGNNENINNSYTVNSNSGSWIWGDYKGTSSKSAVYNAGVCVFENSAIKAITAEVVPSSVAQTVADVAVTKDETAIEVESSTATEAVNTVVANTATVNATTEIASESVEGVSSTKNYLHIDVKAAEVAKAEETTYVKSMTFDIKPIAATITDGKLSTEVIPNSAIKSAITFRLPVDANATETTAEVFHNGVSMGSNYQVQGTTEKYIEVSTTEFSEFGYQLLDAPAATYVAQIGEVKYETLADAVAAANANDEIILIADQEISSAIEISKNLTLNLNGKTITNNVASNRLFRVGGVTFTIDGTVEGCSMIIPETNKYSFGFVDMRNMSGSASSDAKLVLNGGYYEGATLGGAFFKGRNHYQTFELNNVHCKCTAGDGQQYYANGYYYNGDNASVVNSHGYFTTLKVVGGLYEHATLAITAGNVFQGYNFMADSKSSVSFDDVKIISTHGPIYELNNGEMTINNCDFTIEGAATWENSALCASYNAVLNVNGGKYNAPYAVYALTSGATININGGEFTGSKSILVAGADYPEAVSTINVSDGKFTYTGSNPSEAFDTYGSSPTTIAISGGTFNVEIPNKYCAEGFVPVDNGNSTWTVKKENKVVSIDVHEDVEISGTETATEAEKTAANEAVTALESNTAVTTEEATNVAEVEEVTTLAITVKEVAVETATTEGVATATVTKVTYDVQPMKDEVKVTETAQPLTFRLPVPQSFTNDIVKVSHNHNGNVETFSAFVQGTGAAKYVELASTKFSDWTIEDIATLESLEITTANDLVKLSTYVNAGNSLSGKTVKLANDIDMTGIENFAPIGTESHRFAGTFDGQNYTISNLTITGTNGCLGLFGYSDHALIKDVTIDKASVTGSGTWGGVASGGAFVSTFDNVTVTNSTVNVDGAYIGAIAGGNYPIVRNCTVTETSVKGKDQVGGIAGYVCGTTIENNTLTKVAVEATEERAGGLIGKWQRADNNVCTVKNNTITEGSAKAPDMAGGIAAQIMGNNEKYSIKYNTIDVTLNAPKTSPIGVLRSSQPVEFTAALAQNIKLNWWTDATLNAETYTYTETETNGAGDQVITRGVPVAKIGEEGYASLAEAVAAVQNDETITLTQDITLDKAVAIGTSANKHARQFTIDFDGKTVTGKANTTMFTVYDDVTFTGNGQADYYGQGQFAYAINAYGNVTIDGVNITDKKNNAGNILKANSGATITLKNGVVTSDKPRGGMVNVANGGAFVMEDGKIVCNYESYNQAYACVYVATGGSATIKGGEMKAAAAAVWVDGIANIEGGKVTAPYTVWVNKGTANISGGKFYANPTAVYLYTATSVANISGGEFWATGTDSKYLINKLDAVRDGAVANITGGIFHDFDPMSNTAEGAATDFTPDNKCTSDAEGVFTVGDCHHTVEIVGTEGKKHYDTLADAVAVATEGQTITMLADADVTAQVEVAGKNITLDLNGKKIEYTGTTTLNSGVILVHNGAGLTINGEAEGSAIVSGENAYGAVAVTKKNDDASQPAVLTVNSGTLTGKYYAVVGNGTRHNTEITINGGNLTGQEGTAIYHPQDGTLNIAGGNLTGKETAVELRAGTINVTGGTLTSTATEFEEQGNGSGTTIVGAALAVSQHATNKDIAVNISGGEFNGINAVYERDYQDTNCDNIAMNITDGTFNGSVASQNVTKFVAGGSFKEVIPQAYCAFGFVPETTADASGMYTVVESNTALEVYVGKSDMQTMPIREFVEAQKTQPNAMAVVSSQSAAEVEGMTNVIVDYLVGKNGHYYECENFVLTDKKDWYSPVNFIAIKGSYSRDNVSGLNSVCMPFELTSHNIPADSKLLLLDYTDVNHSEVYFKRYSQIAAGQACIMDCSSYASLWNVEFDETEISASYIPSALVGAYSKRNIGEGYYKVSEDGGHFVHTMSSSTITPFRCCLDLISDGSLPLGNNLPALRIVFEEDGEDGVEGISEVTTTTEDNVKIYGIDGVLRSNVRRGLNIIQSNGVSKKIYK